MTISMRWFGPTDPVSLAHIRQVPVVTGIVSALYDVPVGEAWPLDKLRALRSEVERHGLRLEVIESVPVHDDIKLGRAGRDHYIDEYTRSVRHLGACGVPVLCYNFMPVFDWTRTELAHPLPDGSTTLAYDDARLQAIERQLGTLGLPGWADAYTPEELDRLMGAYRDLGAQGLFENLRYFLQRVVPVAEQAGVKLAIHPDDPPWPILGLPRIVSTEADLWRILDAVPSPSNGLTFCTGSLGARPDNDLPGMVRRLAHAIHFFHARNVRVTAPHSFQEVPHPSHHGNVRFAEALLELQLAGFEGPIRPDHGRMIWGESGRPGYGLYDRALGAMYVHGLLEGARRTRAAAGRLPG